MTFSGRRRLILWHLFKWLQFWVLIREPYPNNEGFTALGNAYIVTSIYTQNKLRNKIIFKVVYRILSNKNKILLIFLHRIKFIPSLIAVYL